MSQRQKVFKHKEFFFLILIILVIAGLIYRNFLLFKQLYIYKDAGNDTFTSYWPYYMFWSQLLKSSGISYWAYQIGLGTNIFALGMLITDPFNLLIAAFGKNNLAFALPYVAVLKIVLAGTFFYMYIKTFKVSPFAAFTGSLLYSFNGYIILWGQHYHFATIMVLAPLLLYCFELWLGKNKWLPFTLVIAVTAAFSYYFFYMLTVYLILYSFFRFLNEFRFNLRKFLTFYLKTIGLYLLGFGLSALVLLPTLAVAFSNNRVGTNIFSTPFFKLNTLAYYISLLTRFFSNTVTVKGMFYPFQSFNYYEMPIVYSGLLTLLLVPQAFKFFDKKAKFLFGSLSIILGIFLLIPFFSIMMNGFSYISYRWTFIIILFMLFLATIALDKIDKNNVDKRLLTETVLSLIGILVITLLAGSFLLHWTYQNTINSFRAITSIIGFLAIYTILLFLLSFKRYRLIVKLALVVVLSIEIVTFSTSVVSEERVTINPDVIKERQLYFDRSNDIISYLDKNDPGFYRIQKGTLTSITDPVVQNFKGTTSYTSLNQPNFVNFMLKHKVSFVDTNPNALAIPNLRELLQTFVGVKYYITTDKNDTPSGYRYLRPFGEYYLYENINYLPLGFTYDKYITETDFDRLSPIQRDEAILKAFVIENGQKVPEGFKQLTAKDLSSLPSLPLEQINREYYKKYSGYFTSDIDKLKKDTLEVTQYSSQNVKGKILLDQNKLLILSIPMDNGWTLLIDGKEIKPVTVNNGFIGVFLNKGQHTVQLQYHPPLMKTGVIVTSIALLIIILMKSKFLLNKVKPGAKENFKYQT